uniref:Uncharacterized protein n=1 Tax=Salix viminalis TaxID=40686 RepID=A0A6N2KR85_SALVM
MWLFYFVLQCSFRVNFELCACWFLFLRAVRDERFSVLLGPAINSSSSFTPLYLKRNLLFSFDSVDIVLI